MSFIIWIDAQEKADVDEQAKLHHDHDLEEFRARENVTEEDIKAYEKAEIIKRSIEDIQKRA